MRIKKLILLLILTIVLFLLYIVLGGYDILSQFPVC